jgi:hypothetical protein
MGYSARYHAASLAAVFLALAIGILIGAGFGDELVRSGTENLEQSLKSDLDNARSQIDDLQSELDRERDYTNATYPALVGGVLRGQTLAIVALGGRPDQLRDDISDALDPSGARIGEVAVVREPPDRDGLADEVSGSRSRKIANDDDSFSRFASRLGGDMVLGGDLYGRARTTLLTGFSGEAVPIDGVVVVRDRPDLGANATDDVDLLEDGLLQGMDDAGIPIVGVQRTDTDPSSVGYFESHGLSTVDDLDLPAGGAALVYALAGAQGNFGVGENADALLPDLLAPRPARTGATASPRTSAAPAGSPSG